MISYLVKELCVSMYLSIWESYPAAWLNFRLDGCRIKAKVSHSSCTDLKDDGPNMGRKCHSGANTDGTATRLSSFPSVGEESDTLRGTILCFSVHWCWSCRHGGRGWAHTSASSPSVPLVWWLIIQNCKVFRRKQWRRYCALLFVLYIQYYHKSSYFKYAWITLDKHG